MHTRYISEIYCSELVFNNVHEIRINKEKEIVIKDDSFNFDISNIA